VFLKISAKVVVDLLMDQHWDLDVFAAMFGYEAAEFEPEDVVSRCPTIIFQLMGIAL